MRACPLECGGSGSGYGFGDDDVNIWRCSSSALCEVPNGGGEGDRDGVQEDSGGEDVYEPYDDPDREVAGDAKADDEKDEGESVYGANTDVCEPIGDCESVYE